MRPTRSSGYTAPPCPPGGRHRRRRLRLRRRPPPPPPPPAPPRCRVPRSSARSSDARSRSFCAPTVGSAGSPPAVAASTARQGARPEPERGPLAASTHASSSSSAGVRRSTVGCRATRGRRPRAPAPPRSAGRRGSGSRPRACRPRRPSGPFSESSIAAQARSSSSQSPSRLEVNIRRGLPARDLFGRHGRPEQSPRSRSVEEEVDERAGSRRGDSGARGATDQPDGLDHPVDQREWLTVERLQPRATTSGRDLLRGLGEAEQPHACSATTRASPSPSSPAARPPRPTARHAPAAICRPRLVPDTPRCRGGRRRGRRRPPRSLGGTRGARWTSASRAGTAHGPTRPSQRRACGRPRPPSEANRHSTHPSAPSMSGAPSPPTVVSTPIQSPIGGTPRAKCWAR